jgi:hypothetical protein
MGRARLFKWRAVYPSIPGQQAPEGLEKNTGFSRFRSFFYKLAGKNAQYQAPGLDYFGMIEVFVRFTV